MTQLQNQYGYFSDDGKEYIITDPQTPMPWVNVIANDIYGFVVSQAGSGYSWHTHASLNRVTRWDQDLIRDEWGKYLYIRDAESGEYWSPTLQPCGASNDAQQVRHGMGYSVFETRRDTLSSAVTYFVPLDATCELWLVRLENHGDTPRHLQLYSYLEWLLGAAPDWHREFHRTFIDTQYNAEHGALLATKVMWELPVPAKAHWNQPWAYAAFHSASVTPAGFDGDKRDFIGRHGSVHQPHAVIKGQSHNHAGRWGDPIASLHIDLTLAPGETREIVFSLGATESVEASLKLADRYKDLGTVHAALDSAQKYWQSVVTQISIQTPDTALNLMANGWLVYQAIAGRLKGRTAYYQTGGAFGFRDQLQDSLLWLLIGQPEKTLAQLRFHAAHQYKDGIVLHWWHPIADTGMRSDYSDDLLWLAFVLIHYLHETGDLASADEIVPFYDGDQATLKEHCMLAFEVALRRRSPRGLPLILKGDWNDGLNAVGGDGRGESVWMAHFLCYVLRGWADLPICDSATAERFRREADALTAAVNQHAWDGEWYWRASTDDGVLVGAKESPEGKIFLNAQTWSVLGGTADAQRAKQAMTSAREHLYMPYGPLLLAPAYSVPDPNIGYLSRYAPGIRENGGVYSHAACWAVLAERKLNGVQAAYDLWRTFCPARRGEEPDVYAGEPYVMPGNISGPLATVPGQAGWTWYTGSAAWYFRALVDGVLGIEARLNGLRVQAALPKEWDHFQVKRLYRGAWYDITIRRAKPGEATQRLVDGAAWAEDVLPIAKAGSTPVVVITL